MCTKVHVCAFLCTYILIVINNKDKSWYTCKGCFLWLEPAGLKVGLGGAVNERFRVWDFKGMMKWIIFWVRDLLATNAMKNSMTNALRNAQAPVS